MRAPFLAVAVLLAPALAAAAGLQVSGGMDARLRHRDGSTRGVMEGLFLNTRKVIQDAKGDRWIFVGQLDADHNLEKVRAYQTYLQYKGPLGRWNLRAGHYILPFGLLAYYDTERLLLQTQEPTSLGIKLDTGAEALGYWESWDYAVSVSQGSGRRRFSDADGNKLLTARFGWSADEARVGLSGMMGDVLLAEEVSPAPVIRDTKRVALDASLPWERWTFRSELAFGSDDGRSVGGGFLGADMALGADWEANLKFARWERGVSTNSGGAGLTYRLRPGLFLRVADEQEFNGRHSNTFSAQVYYEFSKSLF